ncbi:cupin domain-containing protein [Bacillus sp. JJ722]|uniref:cupin domain-containing protein n=1 Tax=Bacillus sp. JJ722 TaxID=3122973 RepID=UPI002FFF557D
MDLFQFDQSVSKKIDSYNSLAISYSKIIKTTESASIGCMYIEPNGVIGYHEAPVPQIFLVVDGEGWVAGEDRKKIAISKGQGVWWNKDEGHTSGSEYGMTAIIIQSPNIDFQKMMK